MKMLILNSFWHSNSSALLLNDYFRVLQNKKMISKFLQPLQPFNRVSAETSLFQLIYLNFKQASDAGYFDRTLKQVYLMGIDLKVK